MEIIDNINTLLGDRLKETIVPGSKLKIAASCFSIYAYEALKNQLEKIDSLEFVFTSPTFVQGEATDKIRKERREFHIPKLERERSLYGTDFEIQLRNKLTQRAIAKECADWIKRKVSFRSNTTKSPMQQYTCVDAAENSSVYLPLHGFTAVDLGYQQGDAVSNFVNEISDAGSSQTYLRLFDQIWQDKSKMNDVTEQVTDYISNVYSENSPERIYFLMLYNIFSEFLEDISEDVLPNDRTGYQESVIWQKLFNFQKDAAIGLINKLETYNGCILADSVGLGKTFTALAVVKYYELRNKSVLVLCPKKLSDNWLTYNQNLKTNILADDRLRYDVLNHTDLQRTSGYSYGTPLNQINWGNYDLVVIDESHNFRNNKPGEEEKKSRYEVLMENVVRAGVKTKVLMLSATPVNNRFADLKNQLALAYEGETENLSSKLRTSMDIDEIFRRAQAAFTSWTKLPPEERSPNAILTALDFDFFELLDSVTIARSRKHIEAYYDTTAIGTFPDRNTPLAFHPPLTSRPDVMSFDEIYTQLSQLSLAVYTPVSYILPSRLSKYEENYESSLKGIQKNISLSGQQKGIRALMTVNLLKRLESSVHSFRLTLGKLEASHRRTLAKIEAYQAGGLSEDDNAFSTFNPEVDEDSEDFPLPEEDSVGGKAKIALEDIDLPSWSADLQSDLFIIESLHQVMDKVTPDCDAKLQHLKTQIQSKLASPLNPGNKKVIIFSAFADTVDYLYKNLSEIHLSQNKLHSAKITGSASPKNTIKAGLDFQSILTLFSPRSKEKDKVLPEIDAEIDLLIATDCISEGQNLQDCDYLINYDIHWNPVRIIQRFGRVDRIGSINAVIQLVNYWPDISLDDYINLKDRVESRMVIADAVATGDDNVLKPMSAAKTNEMSYRQEQLRKLQDEVIELEDVKTGISITDLGLNDFRMDLVGYVKENGNLDNIPSGMHAIVPADPSKGLLTGVIFTLRNRNQEVNINQQNRLHPYYLVYIDNEGQIITQHTEVKRILDLARLSSKGRVTPIKHLCDDFNAATKEGRDMQRYSDLLDQAIGSMVQTKEEGDIDSLFSAGKTTAMEHNISGLDDFELISFIVIQ